MIPKDKMCYAAMREVPVPIGFAAHSRRHVVALIAIWLVVLQAFFAGLATAQAGVSPASDPVGVICHAADDGRADTTPTGSGQVGHLCCDYCLSGIPVLSPPDAPGLAAPQPLSAPRLPLFSRLTIRIAPGAVRAGFSQAPPAPA
jgi:hypothetical protein